jgi:hypothetical protein
LLVDPAVSAAWCELGYVVTEDNRYLFSAGDTALCGTRLTD